MVRRSTKGCSRKALIRPRHSSICREPDQQAQSLRTFSASSQAVLERRRSDPTTHLFRPLIPPFPRNQCADEEEPGHRRRPPSTLHLHLQAMQELRHWTSGHWRAGILSTASGQVSAGIVLEAAQGYRHTISRYPPKRNRRKRQRVYPTQRQLHNPQHHRDEPWRRRGSPTTLPRAPRPLAAQLRRRNRRPRSRRVRIPSSPCPPPSNPSAENTTSSPCTSH